MSSPYTEPVLLRDEYTGQLVLDAYGRPIVVGETIARPPLALYGSQASYLPTAPMVLEQPGIVRTSAYPGYRYGPGCCAAGCCGGLGCTFCCQQCCDDCAIGCDRCWYYC